MTLAVPRSWFYLLFTLSGFAGLIYESIWSHYLKLFLGHAAYAQTLVLAIFMGGMALGSWMCSRYTGGWRNLLLGYAIAEALIGASGLVFHRVFVAATDLTFDSVIPSLAMPIAVNLFKWSLSALLILPQSILLGMTFPLMTAGIIRAYPGGSGGAIAMLYFTNSLGAAVGVLASGFVLIALVGLPGTILTAGLLNILLAAVVWLLARAMPGTSGAPGETRDPGVSTRTGVYRLLLAVSLLTGAASFIYEIGWIRMLSMVLGSSTHAFELMLSAFILGLAFGSLWIRRRIDRTDAPERLLGLVQVAMGLLALATLALYGRSFEIMQWLLSVLARNQSGYALFNLGSHFIALTVMFPAAFCAGMTLPLITHSLIRRGAGVRAIGAVYAANTAGAILGVFAAVHIGLPALGLKGMITFGATVDIGLGLLLLGWATAGRRLLAISTTAGVAGIAATLVFVQLDPYKMASGVYRHRALLTPAGAEILFHRDGKTATIDLVRTPDRISIHTNGKSDAAIYHLPGDKISPDETTMVLIGALPLAYKPDAKTAANVGFGSGLSSHVLLASDTLRELDTIEIEAAMVEAAHGFRPRNDNVYGDSRSRIHIEDAKTFFSTRNKRYDVITSEPSNPWVSGVASLFTREFYARVKQHLVDDGIFVQWMHLYEITTPLVATVFAALALEFDDYAVYTPNQLDLIIVATKNGRLPPLTDRIFHQRGLADEIARIKIKTLGDLELHRVGGRSALEPYFASLRVAANSDFFPVLDLNAAKARYMGSTAPEIPNLSTMRIPALEMLSGESNRRPVTEAERPWLDRAQLTSTALAIRAYLLKGGVEQLDGVPAGLRSEAQLARLRAIDCAGPPMDDVEDHLHAVAGLLMAVLTPEELRPVWSKFGDSPCVARLGEQPRAWLDLFAAVGARDAVQMAQLAERLLSTGNRHTDAQESFLLGAALTGLLAREERELATALWKRYGHQGSGAGNDLLLEFLRAHLFRGPTKDRPATIRDTR